MKLISTVCINVIGEKGERGQVGPVGSKGEKGDTGPQGPAATLILMNECEDSNSPATCSSRPHGICTDTELKFTCGCQVGYYENENVCTGIYVYLLENVLCCVSR